MSATTNDQADGGTPSRPGTQGADNARAYVPPQSVRAKPQPSDIGETQKVQIKERPDQGSEEPSRGTLPAGQPVPPEALNHPSAVGHVGGPATPFEQPPPRVDDALPFRRPEMLTATATSAAPAAATAPMNGAVAGGGFVPKRPPRELTSPGVLTPAHGSVPLAAAPAALPSPVAMAAPAGHGAPAAVGPEAGVVAPAIVAPAIVAPAIVAPAHEAPITPVTPPVAAPPVVPPPVGLPGAVSSPVPPPPITPVSQVSDELTAEVAVPSPQPAHAANRDHGHREGGDEHPLAATNSPWTAAEKVDADELPSADFLPSAQVQVSAAPPAPAVAEERTGGSRTLMTMGLLVAALALVGAVVYFTMIDRKRSGPEDPAKVKVGTEQRDYDMDTDGPAPGTSSTVDAAPEPSPAPRPVIVPKVIPKSTAPKPPPTRKSAEDIYDGL